jgi:hypothetical protein
MKLASHHARLSCSHTHQQQGCVEGKHHHVIDTTLAFLADSGLLNNFGMKLALHHAIS